MTLRLPPGSEAPRHRSSSSGVDHYQVKDNTYAKLVAMGVEEQEDGATIVWLVGEAFRLSRRWIEEVVRELGITATQLSILKRLDFFPGISRANSRGRPS